VTGATEWHINADEVNLLDYNDTVLDTGETDYFEAKPTATSLYNADAYRSTDHDPVLVGLNLATTDDLSDLTGYPVAWHSSNGLKLGATWAAGHSTVGSGTNDGVVRTPGIAWSPASGGSVDVTVNGATGYVTGWIDWNNDSDFGDTGEQILTNEAFTAGQSRTIHFTIPATAPIAGGSGSAFDARFRVYPTVQTVLALAAAAPDAVDAAPLPSDGATGGEVEDYTWSFGPNAVTLRGFGATGGAAPAWPAAAGLGLLAATVVIWRRRR
jgi:LPXTG-motif cell wall-anchored protein